MLSPTPDRRLFPRLMSGRSFRLALWVFCVVSVARVLNPNVVFGDAPSVSYIFPTGGQRGTTVNVRVGGHFLSRQCPWQMVGPGVTASPTLTRTETVWFEGPLANFVESQLKEDYPKDQAGTVRVEADAPLGVRHWQVWTAQGATPAMKFVVGDLPEIIEQETDGAPLPTAVTLPVTINGRIFPREDVDIWSFEAAAGESVTCEVQAARLGSPLEARLEILDPRGRPIAENSGALSGDPRLRFVAPEQGTYRVRIHDIKFGGLQHYVYRLTITKGPCVEDIYPLGARRGTQTSFSLTGQGAPATPVILDLPQAGTDVISMRFQVDGVPTNSFLVELDDLSEVIEDRIDAVPNQVATLPAVLNGKISRPGEVDVWTFVARQGDVWDFDLRAARLGSPLDGTLALVDSQGKELIRNDDISGSEPDAHFQFMIPAEGTYALRVADQVSSRGGPRFAYRLKIASPAAPGFRLRLSTDALNLVRTAQVNFKVFAERFGGFNEEIALELTNLPAGVKAENLKIPAKQNEVQVALHADESARIQAVRLQVRGTATISGEIASQTATLAAPRGEPELDSLLLAVCLPTPFKYGGTLETKYVPRGSTFVRHFTLDRGGYNGPLEISLADRQFRHLQGITGPTLTIPAGVNEFDFPIFLPPKMMLGRTCRTVLAAEGVIEEPDGGHHVVSYASTTDDNQIVVVIDPARLTIDAVQRSIRARRGKSAEIPFQLGRSPQLAKESVRVELAVPEHIRGISAKPIDVAGGENTGRLVIQFADETLGPFNMPVTLRAVAVNEGKPHVAESQVEIVADK